MKKTKKKTKAPRKAKPARTVQKAPASRPVKFTGEFARFRKILENKRQDILDTVKHNESNIATTEIGDELDVASQTFEREMMFELTNGERVVLDDIEAALRKIEKGEFSLCESCRKKIPSVRLNAMPWARNCIACQSRNESGPRF